MNRTKNYMQSEEGFYLAFAFIIFLLLSTWIMLPPPLNKFGKFMQASGAKLYEIAKIVGIVRDEDICVLADLDNLGGMEATYIDREGNEKNISCALLTERKIAITPADKEKYGKELGGEVIKVWIKDKRNLNKLFYFSYVWLAVIAGSLVAEIVAEIYTLGMGKNYSAGKVFGYSVALIFGMTMVLLRSGAIWDLAVTLSSLAPTQGSLMATAISSLLLFALFSWVIGEMALGYYTAKKHKEKLEAIRLAAEADYRRGRAALEARNRMT